MSKRLGGIIGCKDQTSSWHLIGFPNGKVRFSQRTTYHTKRKRQWYKKYSEKVTSPNKQKEKRKNQTRVAIGACISKND